MDIPRKESVQRNRFETQNERKAETLARRFSGYTVERMMKTLDQRKNAEFGWNGNKFLPLFLMLVPLRKEWIAIQEKESQMCFFVFVFVINKNLT